MPTDVRHRVEVLETQINGEGLADNDEIGVFTPEDLCAGAFVINGNERVMIDVWGDDPETDDIDGFREGQIFGYKVWDNDAEREHVVNAIYIRGNDRWRDDGYSAVRLITGEEHFSWLETQLIHEIQISRIRAQG